MPPQFSKLAEKSNESSEWLFGDSVSKYVENIEKENKLMSLLKDKKDSGKRKHSEASSDSRFSFKSQKRTPEYGQNFSGYHLRSQKTPRISRIIKAKNTAGSKPDVELG